MLSKRMLTKWRKDALIQTWHAKGVTVQTFSAEIVIDLNKRILALTQELLDNLLFKEK